MAKLNKYQRERVRHINIDIKWLKERRKADLEGIKRLEKRKRQIKANIDG